MARIHTVRRGESLSKIAAQYGIKSWRTIYDDPGNAAFRKKRPNPNRIEIGDEIVIPEASGTAAAPPAATTPAPAAELPVDFSLVVHDARSPTRPFAGLTVKLLLPGGDEKELTTNASGMIEIGEPEITAGDVDVLQIRDATEAAVIRYDEHAVEGFGTNQTNQLLIPDKRSLIHGIARAHRIARRSEWGKKSPRYATMEPDWEYTTVVIHHSGDGGETDPVQIEKQHMEERGFDDVGYHYMIKPDGSIYEGRHLAYKGSHVEKANSHKIGILLMGDYEHQIWDVDDDPSAPQMVAAVELIKTLKAELGTIVSLGGHRDYKQGTECPGGAMYAHLDALRKATGLGGP
jgi:hypothetical protein